MAHLKKAATLGLTLAMVVSVVPMTSLAAHYEEWVKKDGKWYLLEYDKEHYFGLASPVLADKTYTQLVITENEKAAFIKNCMDTNMGVRCFTVHSAKGLEADIVYLLDCNSGVFPNDIAIKKTYEIGCGFSAAKDVRADRNLLYVAVTRAKSKCIIAYESVLSPLVKSPRSNEYDDYDAIFKRENRIAPNGYAFKKLFNLPLEQDAEASDGTLSSDGEPLLDPLDYDISFRDESITTIEDVLL